VHYYVSFLKLSPSPYQHKHICAKQNLVSTASYYYVLRACNKFQDFIMYLVHISLEFHTLCALLYELHTPSFKQVSSNHCRYMPLDQLIMFRPPLTPSLAQRHGNYWEVSLDCTIRGGMVFKHFTDHFLKHCFLQCLSKEHSF
jgi:hypothetical protein